MSVRRLADDSVQPLAFSFNRANSVWAEQVIRKYPEGRQQSAVIPLLMRAQEQEGWVTRAAIEYVAQMLDMPLIRVLEVATFYTQFQLKPVGTRAHIQLCGTTPCMLRGAEELKKVCQHKINHEPFETNADGTLSWEEVECLGACVNAPMVMIFKDTYEDLTPERLEEIIDAFEAGRGDEVKPGPQIDRVFSAPAGGLTSLNDNVAVKPKAAKNGQRVAAADADLPPSEAARPKTHSAETSEAIKSPSSVKVSKAAEDKASTSPAPGFSQDDKYRPVGAVGAAQDASDADLTPSRGKMSKAAGSRTSSAPGRSLDDKDRPVGIERPAEVDDLKLISGVGPKIEGILHELGIYTYAQVAAWKKPERDWVDGYLKFKGRIEREDWVKQAKALAKGGVAEYVRVFGKKPV
ncbi:NADH-quinone oxidoreductase subunit E [Phyllobacterium salinisoli]|uniref:NADH-quinone oxidoreductase subunit E n=1 Tax=Phyllobacterium salinisoli TaxID=1899321 RepID=A0A368JYI9_9HYPH|nr:NADH-quinone oxidoreductase subunit E [Phyllobacterium salinisoli]RCS21964.1 NADH-quinone oxidoreductase subunit E [Phyllobacterium salinisoli]